MSDSPPQSDVEPEASIEFKNLFGYTGLLTQQQVQIGAIDIYPDAGNI